MAKLTLGQIAFLQGMGGLVLDLSGKELSDELEVIPEENGVEASERSHIEEYINGAITTLAEGGVTAVYGISQTRQAIKNHTSWYYNGLQDQVAPRFDDFGRSEFIDVNYAYSAGRVVATHALSGTLVLESIENNRLTNPDQAPFKAPTEEFSIDGLAQKGKTVTEIKETKSRFHYKLF